MAAYFSNALFTFLRDLKANNDREWFKANKKRYETALKDPALSFIADFGPHLHKLSPHFVAEPKPVGGSLFRIHRDTRFAKDKSPYKTTAGIHFRHESAKDAHAPGFYLHLAPGDCFVGMGLWRPEPAIAGKIRHAIVDQPKLWKSATTGNAFKASFSLAGESLKRPPRGFDGDHPFIDDLKRKDFMATAKLSQKQVVSSSFMKDLAKALKPGAPFVKFLCGAVGVPY